MNKLTPTHVTLIFALLSGAFLNIKNKSIRSVLFGVSQALFIYYLAIMDII